MSDPTPPARSDGDVSRLSRGYVAIIVAAVSFVALTCVAFLVPVPYVTMRPGPAFDTLGEIDGSPMFTFGEDVQTYDTEGVLDFTTVSVTRANGRVFLADAVGAYFSRDVAVVPRDVVYPDGESADESREQGAAQLTSSKDSSRAAGLRAAGFEVPETPQVVDVVEDGASADLLEPEDLILTAEGEDVQTSTDVVDAIGAVTPGDEVTLRISRDGEERSVDLTTQPSPDDPERPLIGITIGTAYDFPVEIENNLGDQVGGPSAGSMFALAIYDRLTPGPLTGGLTVAGTGEVAGDGTVGQIGGIRQKMAGAAADGATVFLVPAENCAEASRGDDHDMTLVSVEDLDDAIEALETLADDPEATVPTCR
ncbi:PDZ domain-containing protein [Aeromicrobium sp. CF4.19]|uniref:YlbL family protein n=1 Tax=Aeromicrobium sp. CF4.19 TaxID=3373082 RepID=UPI003EE61079